MSVPRLPSPGGYVEIENEATYLGGEAANTAVALRHWGKEVRLVGNELGTEIESDLLRELLGRHAFTDLDQGEGQTPVCDIYVTPDGERTMFGRGFASMEIALDAAQLPFEPDQWFTAEPNMSVVSRQVARAARRAGMKLYLMDFFQPNDPIFEGTFWQSSTDWVSERANVNAQLAWVNDWIDRHGCFAILSDGPRGFVAGSPDVAVRHYATFPAPKVVDMTGAGDMFRAAMLFGLDSGWAVPRCLGFASAAGSLGVGTLGATTSVPEPESIQKLIDTYPSVARQFS
jgi:sugar/nucleoside kinase (ribokinase family)